MKTLEAMRVFVSLSFALASALHSSVADASCKDSCDNGFSSASSCWCDDFCSGYGDCCVDYAAQCSAPPVPACQGPLRAGKPATLLQARPPFALAPGAFPTLGSTLNQEVGIGGCGAAHLSHEDVRYQAHAFYYRPGVGWGPRHTFAGPALDIRIATAVNGVATAVWDNDQNEVLAARFE